MVFENNASDVISKKYMTFPFLVLARPNGVAIGQNEK